MENTRQVIHFVDHDIRIRAELARAAFALGHHAEVYADLAELCRHPPRNGIVVVAEAAAPGGAAALLDTLAEWSIWLPLVMMAPSPSTGAVVSAIKQGALDYLSLPLETGRLERMLDRIAGEARAHSEARRRMVEARGRIANLSAREREVLDWLALGSSNKAIARELAISPRTVEIHRANMMTKLGASHSAEAVRLRIESALDRTGLLRLAG